MAAARIEDTGRTRIPLHTSAAHDKASGPTRSIFNSSLPPPCLTSPTALQPAHTFRHPHPLHSKITAGGKKAIINRTLAISTRELPQCSTLNLFDTSIFDVYPLEVFRAPGLPSRINATPPTSLAPLLTSTNMAATPALREVLNEGISSGNFIDTKIILYSRRDSRGHVCQPKALYANSHVLKTAPHFKDCECPIATATLEEPCDTVLKVLSGDFAESQPEDLSEPNGEGESVDDYGYLSDSDLEDDEEPPEANPSLKSDINREDNGDENKFSCEFHQERVEKCKVIRIPDMAFVT